MSGKAEVVAQVTVLVVEDDDLVLDLVTEALKEAGYTVAVRSSGTEAISALESSTDIAAVVTDIDLGTVLGWEVAKRARELNPSIPVIYMTGAAAEDWSAHGVPNSILINKPFAPAQVVTAVSQLLNASTSSAD